MAEKSAPDFGEAWRQSWQEWASAFGAFGPPAARPAGDVAPAAEPPTPTEAWKRSADVWLAAWTEYLETNMVRPEFAAGVGQSLDSMLNVAKPLGEQNDAAMQRFLRAANMPSRQDIVRLASQVNDVNARLDDLSDQMEQIGDLLATLIAAQGKARAAEGRGGDDNRGGDESETGRALGTGGRR